MKENVARSVYPTSVKIRVQDGQRESCILEVDLLSHFWWITTRHL